MLSRFINNQTCLNARCRSGCQEDADTVITGDDLALRLGSLQAADGWRHLQVLASGRRCRTNRVNTAAGGTGCSCRFSLMSWESSDFIFTVDMHSVYLHHCQNQNQSTCCKSCTLYTTYTQVHLCRIPHTQVCTSATRRTVDPNTLCRSGSDGTDTKFHCQ